MAFQEEYHLFHLLHVGTRGKALAALPVLLLATATLHADSRLQISTPENGLVVNAGGDLTVTIKTTTAAFRTVSISGDGPFALSTSLNAPPYQYSYPIPAGFASGRYRLKAAGITASGETITSDPIEVDVERTDKPKKLQSEWQSLTLAEKEDTPMTIWGVFPDGTKVDLTRSTQTSYTSDRPDVAAVSNEGALTGAAAGKAKIVVKYGDKSVIVPVVVTPGAH